MTASILQQLLALYFSITYSWQLSSSEKSLVGIKNSSIYFKGFTDLDFYNSFVFQFFSFSLTNVCLPRQVCKAYPVLWAANRFVGSETPKHNDFDQFWKLNTISNIF